MSTNSALLGLNFNSPEDTRYMMLDIQHNSLASGQAGWIRGVMAL